MRVTKKVKDTKGIMKAYRISKGFTQAELAEKLGVCKLTIIRIERGDNVSVKMWNRFLIYRRLR